MIIKPGTARHQYLHSTESIDSAEMHAEPIKNERMKNNEPIKKESKKVRFSHSVQVREILHCSNFTEEERTNSWYTKCDIAQRKREEKQTLDFLKSGAYQGDCDQHCVRGLECRTRKGALARRQSKEAARLAVLKEQDMQNYEFQNNPEAIAKACIAATKYSVMAAYAIAAFDQLYASHISDVQLSEMRTRRTHHGGVKENLIPDCRRKDIPFDRTVWMLNPRKYGCKSTTQWNENWNNTFCEHRLDLHILPGNSASLQYIELHTSLLCSKIVMRHSPLFLSESHVIDISRQLKMKSGSSKYMYQYLSKCFKSHRIESGVGIINSWHSIRVDDSIPALSSARSLCIRTRHIPL